MHLMPREDMISELSKLYGQVWPHVIEARNRSLETRDKLAELIVWEKKAVPADTALVVFGSLARNEWTSGSDLDWTLLVDGQASPDHFDLAKELRGQLEAGFNGPGATGIFGNITFSHDLVHNIGGDEDTNKNTTKRILLLLESCAIGKEIEPHSRVVNSVLSRYVRQEANHLDRKGGQFKVPRFLLNDVVRYWRTMAVDFARKEREGGTKWGIRNAKLQVSRKLIFVAGLLMCFKCHMNLKVEAADEHRSVQENKLVGFLRKDIQSPPLERLAETLMVLGVDHDIGKELFRCYDEFLALLEDTKKREHLTNTVTPETARADTVFLEATSIGKKFDAALQALFFDDPKLKPLTRIYGVF
jgi:predicted nucleotidyltransferase